MSSQTFNGWSFFVGLDDSNVMHWCIPFLDTDCSSTCQHCTSAFENAKQAVPGISLKWVKCTPLEVLFHYANFTERMVTRTSELAAEKNPDASIHDEQQTLSDFLVELEFAISQAAEQLRTSKESIENLIRSLEPVTQFFRGVELFAFHLNELASKRAAQNSITFNEIEKAEEYFQENVLEGHLQAILAYEPLPSFNEIEQAEHDFQENVLDGHMEKILAYQPLPSFATIEQAEHEFQQQILEGHMEKILAYEPSAFVKLERATEVYHENALEKHMEKILAYEPLSMPKKGKFSKKVGSLFRKALCKGADGC